MKTHAYKARLENGDQRGVVVTFPDVPEAITQGDDRNDAMALAEEVLGLALLHYAHRGRALPQARTRARDLVLVGVAPEVAAKLALIEAFRSSGMTLAALAERLGSNADDAAGLLDPDSVSPLPALKSALSVFGIRVVVGVTEAA